MADRFMVQIAYVVMAGAGWSDLIRYLSDLPVGQSARIWNMEKEDTEATLFQQYLDGFIITSPHQPEPAWVDALRIMLVAKREETSP